MSIFEISAATDRIRLEVGEERDLSLTITCVSDGCPRAKMWVEFDDEALAQAVRIVDENGALAETAYRQFEPSLAHTLRLRVTPPPELRGVESTLKLVVADDEQIETTKRYGPALRIEIGGEPPPPPPPPWCRWWPVAVAIAVLLIASGVTAWYLLSRVDVVLLKLGQQPNQVIQTVFQMTETNLRDPTRPTPKLPVVIAEGLTDEEAADIKQEIEAAGGTVRLE